MFRKISLPLMVTVMCLMVSVVLGLFWINQKRQSPTRKTSETEEKITRTDYGSVARKTLDWIDKQRNDEGWYILERGCDFEAKTCDTVWDNAEGNKDGLIATWARFNYYQQTKNPTDLAIVKSDIDKFYEKYPNGVDNALWICKITYEMWKSDLFDQETKGKLEKICFNTDFPTSEEVSNLISEKEKLIEKMKNETGMWSSWDGYSLFLRGYDAYLNYSTDYIYRYLWKKDFDDLKKAQYYLAAIKEDVIFKKLSTENKCLLGLSSLDLYEFSVETDIDFNYAATLYDELITNSDDSRSVTTPICGLLTKRLYQLTDDQKYLSNLEFFSRILVKFNNDSTTNKIMSNDGFWKSNQGTFYTWYKNVAENGVIVELLRD
jgi:hypothetical protein